MSVDRVALTSLAQPGVTEEIDKAGGFFKFVKPGHLYPLITAILHTTTGYDGFLNNVLLVDNGKDPVLKSLVSDWSFLEFTGSEGKPWMVTVLELGLSPLPSNICLTKATLSILRKNFQIFRVEGMLRTKPRINYFYFFPELL